MSEEQFARFMELIELRFQQLDAKIDLLAARLEERMDRLEARMDRLEVRMDNLEAGVKRLQIEMQERFQSVNDRLDALERRVGFLNEGFDDLRTLIFGIRGDVEKLTVRMDRLDASNYELTVRINGLGDDMRQRFRGVTDRLSAVEQQLAA